MNPQELEILHMTTALRTGMMETLTDADLAFSFPHNPTLGELCVNMGETQRSYIDSFKTFKQQWGLKTAEAGIEGSVERLRAWYKALDEELDAVLKAIPDTDLQTKLVDRGGFSMPIGMQFHTYREAILIFCAKSSVYLAALGKPFSAQWQGWIG